MQRICRCIRISDRSFTLLGRPTGFDELLYAVWRTRSDAELCLLAVCALGRQVYLLSEALAWPYLVLTCSASLKCFAKSFATSPLAAIPRRSLLSYISRTIAMSMEFELPYRTTSATRSAAPLTMISLGEPGCKSFVFRSSSETDVDCLMKALRSFLASMCSVSTK